MRLPPAIVQRHAQAKCFIGLGSLKKMIPQVRSEFAGQFCVMVLRDQKPVRSYLTADHVFKNSRWSGAVEGGVKMVAGWKLLVAGDRGASPATDRGEGSSGENTTNSLPPSPVVCPGLPSENRTITKRYHSSVKDECPFCLPQCDAFFSGTVPHSGQRSGVMRRS